MTCAFWRTRSTMQRASKRMRVSAGLLMFRRTNGGLEVLLERARIEFEEELGFPPKGDCIPLGSVKQRGGKAVHAWGIEDDLPPAFEVKSNFFEMEWPPRSGKCAQFPEIDRAEFFPEEIARRKINPAQVAFLDCLKDK